MSNDIGRLAPGAPASSEGTETFSDGQNRIVSTRLSLEAFLAHEDARMTALIQLYLEHHSPGLPPMSSQIPPEKIALTGMMGRTHCLRVGRKADDFRYTVWAQDAAFDGYRSLQNAMVEELTTYESYGVLFEAVKHQLAITVAQKEPTFFEVKGQASDHYYFFTKAILPLGDEQGEIVKCLVPFTNKLPDVPANLRQKLLSGDVD